MSQKPILFPSILFFIFFALELMVAVKMMTGARLCPQVPVTKKPPSFPSIVGETVSVPRCRKHPKQPQLAATKGSMQSSVGLNQG